MAPIEQHCQTVGGVTGKQIRPLQVVENDIPHLYMYCILFAENLLDLLCRRGSRAIALAIAIPWLLVIAVTMATTWPCTMYYR